MVSDQTVDRLVAVHQGYVPAAALATAQARIAELETALEFYADEQTYFCTPWAEGLDGLSRIDKDYGARARAALGETDDER